MSAHTENIQFGREDVEFEMPNDLPEKLNEELSRLEELFTVDTALLKKITDAFGQELQAGTYLTIDLGGTNLRVCLITLTEETGGSDVRQEKYQLATEIKTSTAEELFDHIADCLNKFVEKHIQDDQAKWCDGKIPVGFTFSYPATQHRIDHGILQTWTKGWDVKGVEGNDVAEMLVTAMEKRDLPVKLVALINDTTGALIASAYNDPETIIGAIFGTGCNAAYMEHVSQIPKIRGKGTTSPKDATTTTGEPGRDQKDDPVMAINCEYGAFDNSHKVLPRTRYDELIDEQSPRPGEQTFEKLSAGLYLGEIFRQVLAELYSRQVIFQEPKLDEKQKKALETPYTLDTSFLSTVENDSSPGLSEAKSTFQNTLAGLTPSSAELTFFHGLAKLIAIRGARLCACGASAICGRIGKRSGHVAADGSVATKHPRFRERWETAMGEILGMKKGGLGHEGIKLTSAEDGSGVGAAVICALTLGKTSKGNVAQKDGMDGTN